MSGKPLRYTWVDQLVATCPEGALAGVLNTGSWRVVGQRGEVEVGQAEDLFSGQCAAALRMPSVDLPWRKLVRADPAPGLSMAAYETGDGWGWMVVVHNDLIEHGGAATLRQAQRAAEAIVTADRVNREIAQRRAN